MALTVAGEVMTGGRSGGPIVTVVEAEAERAGVPEFAENPITYVPACPEDGVQAKVPTVRSAFTMNDAPTGRPEAVNELIGSLSASETVAENSKWIVSDPLTLWGAERTGSRFGVIVSEVVAAAVPPLPSETPHSMRYVPASPAPRVPLS